MTWPAYVLWVMIVVAFFMRGPLGLFYLFYATGAIGTLLMVPGNVVGGINLMPQSFCALFLLLKLFVQPGGMSGALVSATRLSDLGYLSLFLIWSLFTAYAMPRFFAGHVDVIPINAVLPDPQPLAPTSANLTQPAYMVLSAGLFYLSAVVGGDKEFRRHFLRANLIAGGLLILTGVVDLATQGTELLAPFRNANYALLTDVEILGSKRIVGLMPEASSYGSACVSSLSILLFLRGNFERQLRLAVSATILGLVTMAVLSTSSTGYVGLGVLGLTYLGSLLWRTQSRNPTDHRGVLTEFMILACAGAAVLVLVFTNSRLLDPLLDLADVLVFQKSQSASYIERSGWTRYAWDAFVATGGWGVGLGSARASNWYYSILSNTGVIGAGLLSALLVQTLARRPSQDEDKQSTIAAGLKFSLIPNLVMAGLSGTTPDIGAQNGVTYGIITALALPPRSSLTVENESPSGEIVATE